MPTPLPNEDAAVVLLFSLVASGQITLRRIDGWRKIDEVINMKTAKALGLTIPPSVLLRADHVIE